MTINRTAQEVHFIGGPANGDIRLLDIQEPYYRVAEVPPATCQACRGLDNPLPLTCKTFEYRVRRVGVNPNTGRLIAIAMLHEWM